MKTKMTRQHGSADESHKNFLIISISQEEKTWKNWKNPWQKLWKNNNGPYLENDADADSALHKIQRLNQGINYVRKIAEQQIQKIVAWERRTDCQPAGSYYFRTKSAAALRRGTAEE